MEERKTVSYTHLDVYKRQVQELEDVFTLKYFCQVINGLHFDKVIVREAHSNVALALLDRVIDLTPIGEIKEAIKLFEHYERCV